MRAAYAAALNQHLKDAYLRDNGPPPPRPGVLFHSYFVEGSIRNIRLADDRIFSPGITGVYHTADIVNYRVTSMLSPENVLSSTTERETTVWISYFRGSELLCSVGVDGLYGGCPQYEPHLQARIRASEDEVRERARRACRDRARDRFEIVACR